jgi:AraC family transcriptional regulator of adaptative response / DNA-3-methyladenine glycosylase II
MRLDTAICERARQSRDPRFDGRFFIGVLTTGIYCRPICPVKAPKVANIKFYASAAAAAEGGFRPCLRCRPELSAGTPDLAERSRIVDRCLRLIAEGEAEEGGVERLARLLEVTPRHLSRLFHEHLGASPITVIRTRRLHFAKRLIDETQLPMATVAFSAGFGSLRRFNATFRELYGRTPTELRRLRRPAAGCEGEGIFELRLAYRPPFDWSSLMAFLATRATPGVEEVVDERYLRTFSFGRCRGFLEAAHLPNENAVSLRVHSSEPEPLLRIVERVRRLFDLGAEMGAIEDHLGRDPALAARVKRRSGLRVPGAWDGFELAVRAILGQQVTVKGATTLAGRLAHTFGERLETQQGSLERIFPSARDLAEADLEKLGITRARSRTLRSLAAAVADGTLDLGSGMRTEQIVRDLQSLPGIGDWTAQYIAMRALGDHDAFPSSDLGLLKAASNGAERITPGRLKERAEAWRPWRSYAAMHLWQPSTAPNREPPTHELGRTGEAA